MLLYGRNTRAGGGRRKGNISTRWSQGKEANGTFFQREKELPKKRQALLVSTADLPFSIKALTHIP
jgi:hypothetical protein